MGSLLSHLSYHADGRLAVIHWSCADEAVHELRDADLALDALRAVADVEVVLFLRELPDGNCKLSARSKRTYDVQRLASGFGGGGHVRAAGARLPGPLAEARERLIEAALGGFEEAENAS